MARLKKLLLLANQHITRFHKELAAKDEQLRVLLACYTRRPGSATAHHLGLLGGLSRLLAALRTWGEQLSRSMPMQFGLRCGTGRVLRRC